MTKTFKQKEGNKKTLQIMISCCMIMEFLIIKKSKMNLSMKKFEGECGI